MTYEILTPSKVLFTSKELVHVRTKNPFKPNEEYEQTSEQNIDWVMVAGAKQLFIHGDQILKTGSAFGDCGSMGQCISSVFETIRSDCEYFSITEESSLSMEIRLKRELVPVICASQENGLFGRFRYKSIPEGYYGWNIDSNGERIDIKDLYSPIRTTVWSSKNKIPKNQEEENALVKNIIENINFNDIESFIKNKTGE